MFLELSIVHARKLFSIHGNMHKFFHYFFSLSWYCWRAAEEAGRSIRCIIHTKMVEVRRIGTFQGFLSWYIEKATRLIHWCLINQPSKVCAKALGLQTGRLMRSNFLQSITRAIRDKNLLSLNQTLCNKPATLVVFVRQAEPGVVFLAEGLISAGFG